MSPRPIRPLSRRASQTVLGLLALLASVAVLAGLALHRGSSDAAVSARISRVSSAPTVAVVGPVGPGSAPSSSVASSAGGTTTAPPAATVAATRARTRASASTQPVPTVPQQMVPTGGVRAAPGKVGVLRDPSTLRVIASEASAPDGTVWQNGVLVVTGTSVVLDGVYVKGSVDFRGTGTLTIRNSRVEASGAAWSVITASNADANLQVVDSTIVWPGAVPPPGQNWGNGAISGDARMTVVRCDISGTPDGIQQGTGTSTFSQNYIHDLAKLPGTHNDGIQLYGGPGVVITDNYIELSGYHGTENSAVFLSDDGDGFASPHVVGNYLSGGGYQLRLEAGVAGAVVTGNDFGPLAGGWGEVLVSPGASVAVWSGNLSASRTVLPAP